MLCIHYHYGLPPYTNLFHYCVLTTMPLYKRMTDQRLRSNQFLNITLPQHMVLAQITGLSVTDMCI